MSASRAAAPGLAILDWIRVLGRAGGALADHSVLHGQLVSLELEQEKARLLRLLLVALLGFATLLCLLFFAGLLVLAVSWDSGYRLHALGGLVLGYGMATYGLWRRLRSIAAAGAQAFAASREEWSADVKLLRNVE